MDFTLWACKQTGLQNACWWSCYVSYTRRLNDVLGGAPLAAGLALYVSLLLYLCTGMVRRCFLGPCPVLKHHNFQQWRFNWAQDPYWVKDSQFLGEIWENSWEFSILLLHAPKWSCIDQCWKLCVLTLSLHMR